MSSANLMLTADLGLLLELGRQVTLPYLDHRLLIRSKIATIHGFSTLIISCFSVSDASRNRRRSRREELIRTSAGQGGVYSHRWVSGVSLGLSQRSGKFRCLLKSPLTVPSLPRIIIESPGAYRCQRNEAELRVREDTGVVKVLK